MLAVMTDIVFLVDESASDINSGTQDWLASVVDDLATELFNADTDARYGLVGFGQGVSEFSHRFAHTQLLGSTESKDYFTSDISYLQTAISSDLAQEGFAISEDGWDSLEHTIAEYSFREGAVPIFVLVQGDQGRTLLNDALTHEGILAALQSKNVILNSIVAGPLLFDGEIPTQQVFEPLNIGANDEPLDPQPEIDWAPIFDLGTYGLSSDLYVLGVEADAADRLADGQHHYHAFDTVTNSVPSTLPTTESDAVQVSHNGSNTGASGMVGSGKSILIGQNITGGIGGLPSEANDYGAKSVPFAMVDMTGATTQSLDTAINFSFPFFGTTESQLWIREDGTISFSDGSPSTPVDPGANNADLSRAPVGSDPLRPVDPTIAALWDDLAPGSGSVLRKVTDVDGNGSGQNDLVIQWTDYAYAADVGTPDPITFQAVLYADGRIRFNYLDVDSHPDNQTPNTDPTADVTGGISATVGIWKGSADAITLPEGKFVPGPHTIFADPAGELPDSYVRMAWDTGGAAWDVGVVDRFGATSAEANALRDAFIGSLGDQILRADGAGKVFRADDVLLALNLGYSIGVVEGFQPDNGTYTVDSGATGGNTNTVSAIVAVDIETKSIPTGVNNVFRSARTAEADQSNLNLRIDTLDGSTAIPDGIYIVELFFAEMQFVSEGSRAFDVQIEGQTVLNDYSIADDRARIINLNFSSTERDSVKAMPQTNIENLVDRIKGVAKRFQVQVTGGELQIDLSAITGATHDPILSAVRILAFEADAPQVVNVMVSSTAHTNPAPLTGEFYFDTVDGSGDQIKTVPLAAIDGLSITFDEDVLIVESDLEFNGMRNGAEPARNGFSYNPTTFTATWAFAAPLPINQYLITLRDSITDPMGAALDGEWINPANHDAQNAAISEFPSGNGQPGGDFAFAMTILPGDLWYSNELESIDADMWDWLYNQAGQEGLSDGQITLGDVNGDGMIDQSDYGELLDLILENWDLRTLSFAADFDSDHDVDGEDIATFISHWQQTVASGTNGDANGDGFVDLADAYYLHKQIGLSFKAVSSPPPSGPPPR